MCVYNRVVCFCAKSNSISRFVIVCFGLHILCEIWFLVTPIERERQIFRKPYKITAKTEKHKYLHKTSRRLMKLTCFIKILWEEYVQMSNNNKSTSHSTACVDSAVYILQNVMNE